LKGGTIKKEGQVGDAIPQRSYKRKSLHASLPHEWGTKRSFGRCKDGAASTGASDLGGPVGWGK